MYHCDSEKFSMLLDTGCRTIDQVASTNIKQGVDQENGWDASHPEMEKIVTITRRYGKPSTGEERLLKKILFYLVMQSSKLTLRHC